MKDGVLFGVDEEHLVDYQGVRMHRDVVPHWEQIQRDAAGAGFELKIASCYRGFEHQLRIWNEKVSGKRKVLDANEVELDVTSMEAEECLWSILRWTALPGSSRHHWGTDVDVYESSTLPLGYRLQLTQAEAASDGVLGTFHDWLSDYIEQQNVFYRPYDGSGCVAYEPWHLSCRPISDSFQQALSKERLVQFIEGQHELLLKDQVLASIDEIYAGLVLRADEQVAHS